jgi:hypothetical protein
MTKVHPGGAPFLCLLNASLSAVAETGRNQVKPIEYSPHCKGESGLIRGACVRRLMQAREPRTAAHLP